MILYGLGLISGSFPVSFRVDTLVTVCFVFSDEETRKARVLDQGVDRGTVRQERSSSKKEKLASALTLKRWILIRLQPTTQSEDSILI